MRAEYPMGYDLLSEALTLYSSPQPIHMIAGPATISGQGLFKMGRRMLDELRYVPRDSDKNAPAGSSDESSGCDENNDVHDDEWQEKNTGLRGGRAAREGISITRAGRG